MKVEPKPPDMMRRSLFAAGCFGIGAATAGFLAATLIAGAIVAVIALLVGLVLTRVAIFLYRREKILG